MTAAEAIADRDEVLDGVAAARPHTTEAGLNVIRAWARRGTPFSLNDCRTELTSAGVTGQYAPGALVRRALQLRIIRKVGEETSTSRRTHGKVIARYIAADARDGLSSLIPTGEVVTVPVQRDRGRFTSEPRVFEDIPLFEVES